MRQTFAKFYLQINGSMFLLLALAFLVLPLPWILAGTVAAIFHELCHYYAIRLCQGRATYLHVDPDGLKLGMAQMSAGKELFCALAGPAGGFLLLLLVRWFPRTAVCAGIHSLYNLLPIYPLDGGRALCCAARMLFSPKTARIVCTALQGFCRASILFLGIYAVFFLRIGLLPLFISFLILYKTFPQKFLAKKDHKEYNKATIINEVLS